MNHVMEKKRHHHRSPRAVKVLLGSLSGIMSTSVVHPCDAMKVRLQLNHDGVGGRRLLSQIARREGWSAFYTGLSAGLFRQACYTTTRLGVYYWLYDHHKKWYGKSPSLSGKLRYGAYAGMIGAFTGCPADMVLVRMMADGNTANKQRYNGLCHAFSKICRDEGVCALWRGGLLTIARAISFSVVQIGSYSHVRKLLTEHRLANGLSLHLYTSLMTSFVTAVVTLPVDLVKTRYQVISDKVSQCAVARQCFQESGVLGFWRGFTPYYIRLSGHTFVTFYFYDILNNMYRKNFEEHKIRT